MQQKDADDAKRRIVMARVGRADDRSRRFDLEFWERVGPEGRFAAAWEMVAETQRMRGGDGEQPRLQRSVLRIERR